MQMTDVQRELVEINARIAGFMAKKYSCSRVASYEDLLQESYLAMCQAALHFEPDQGAAFGTYAYSCIQNYLNTQYKKEAALPVCKSIDSCYVDCNGEVKTFVFVDEKAEDRQVQRVYQGQLEKYLLQKTQPYKRKARLGIQCLILESKYFGRDEIAAILKVSREDLTELVREAKRKMKKDPDIRSYFLMSA